MPSSELTAEQLILVYQTAVASLHHLQKLVGSYSSTNKFEADNAPTAAAKELLHPSIAGVADEARVVYP